MAFTRSNWTKYPSALNSGKDTGGGQVVPAVGGPDFFGYQISTNTAAEVSAANYFADAAFDLCVGDFIFTNASDAFVSLRVLTVDRTVNPATVTTETLGLANAIGTANIVDGAVTTAKIDDEAVTSIKLELPLVRYARVSVSLANFIAANTAPVALITAPGAGLKHVLHRAALTVDYGGTVLAAGGTVQVIYGVTAGIAGAIASNTLAAATLIAATADTMFGFAPVNTTLTDAITVNAALSLSAETADFTGGTGSTYEVDVWYSTVPV